MDALNDLRKHYTLRQIEDKCNMPHFTLRPDRGVPRKYKQAIIDLQKELLSNITPNKEYDINMTNSTQVYEWREGRNGYGKLVYKDEYGQYNVLKPNNGDTFKRV